MCYLMGREEIQKQINKYFPPFRKFLCPWECITQSLGIPQSWNTLLGYPQYSLEQFPWVRNLLFPKGCTPPWLCKFQVRKPSILIGKTSGSGNCLGFYLNFLLIFFFFLIHSEPSMPGYQLLPEINYWWKNPYTHDKTSILYVLVLATESSNVRAGFWHSEHLAQHPTWHSSCHPLWHCCESHSSHALRVGSRNPRTITASLMSSSAEFTDTSACIQK